MNTTSLHTVNKPALTDGALLSCLRVAQANDCILLIEDGVYSAAMLAAAYSSKPPSPAETELKTLLDKHSVRLCLLEEDLQARGIAAESLPVQLEVVSYTGFVQLVVDHPKSVSWF